MARRGSDRASMREGPLAALFRRTDESDEPQEPVEAAEVPAPRTPAAQAAEPAPAPAPEPPVAERREEPRFEPRHEAPHPSLSHPSPPAPEPEPTPIPSPQERLRHAFSSDIPDNVMAPPAPPQAPAAEPEFAPATRATVPAPPSAPPPYLESDPFTRPQAPAATPFGQARPVGHPTLRVVGVGGAGVNAVNRMVEAEVEGVEFVAINTDMQSLQQSAADVTLSIGEGLTRGLGSGSNPDLGRASAMEEYDRIKAHLKGSDMIFITAGAGGGTGTGAAPVVARIARELGALTVGIVTKPFGFEGSRRKEQADRGIQALADEVDTLIVVPNNRLLSVLDKNTSMVEAFRVADDVLRQGVQGISDLVTLPGLINLDFADVRTIMSEAGNALLGIGMGTGDKRAIEAAEQAVASPLLETSMEGARKILLSITGGRDLSLWEVNEAAKAVADAAHPDANIIFGAMVDEKLADDVCWITVVATGYGDQRAPRPERGRFDEPAGEPRVERRTQPPSRRPEPRTRDLELEVPEFLPRR
jgi:cell division protein FtsZ